MGKRRGNLCEHLLEGNANLLIVEIDVTPGDSVEFITDPDLPISNGRPATAQRVRAQLPEVRKSMLRHAFDKAVKDAKIENFQYKYRLSTPSEYFPLCVGNSAVFGTEFG